MTKVTLDKKADSVEKLDFELNKLLAPHWDL